LIVPTTGEGKTRKTGFACGAASIYSFRGDPSADILKLPPGEGTGNGESHAPITTSQQDTVWLTRGLLQKAIGIQFHPSKKAGGCVRSSRWAISPANTQNLGPRCLWNWPSARSNHQKAKLLNGKLVTWESSSPPVARLCVIRKSQALRPGREKSSSAERSKQGCSLATQPAMPIWDGSNHLPTRNVPPA